MTNTERSTLPALRALGRAQMPFPPKLFRDGLPPLMTGKTPREVRIMLLGFERLQPDQAHSTALTVIVAEMVLCRVTAVRMDGALGLVLEVA